MFRRCFYAISALVLAGIVAGAAGLGADAPLIALALASAAGVAVYRWPKVAPRGLAVAAALRAQWEHRFDRCP